jgi:integrase
LRFSQQGPQGIRNHALVRLAAGAGLRIGEIAALRMGDILWRDGEIEVRGITSKSRRSRRVTMHREVAAALDRYIDECREGLEDDAAPVFLTRTAQGFTVGGLASVFRALSRESGVRVSAHLLRHTWATNYRRAGSGDLLDLEAEGGWRDMRMVMRYSHERPQAERQRAPSPFTVLEQKSGIPRSNAAYAPRFIRKTG